MLDPGFTVVVAPDKFKGSLTAVEVAAAVAEGVRAEVPDATVIELPLADGGDGSVAAALSAGFTAWPVDTVGPTGEPITAGFPPDRGVPTGDLDHAVAVSGR